jgi:hypothetical protein
MTIDLKSLKVENSPRAITGLVFTTDYLDKEYEQAALPWIIWKRSCETRSIRFKRSGSSRYWTARTVERAEKIAESAVTPLDMKMQTAYKGMSSELIRTAGF